MKMPEPQSSNSLRYFAFGVLCVAVALGGYFMQLNAKTDRQRQETAERLALCRQIERAASATSAGALELSESCRKLINRSTDSGVAN